jgi:hypothetical protein
VLLEAAIGDERVRPIQLGQAGDTGRSRPGCSVENGVRAAFEAREERDDSAPTLLHVIGIGIDSELAHCLPL